MPPFIKLIRPHQWSKNLLAFVGLLAAHQWAEPQAWIAALQMFAALSLMASALLASLVSRMISRPLYSTMSQLMMRSMRDGTPGPAMPPKDADSAPLR